jgi:hypothetical protein
MSGIIESQSTILSVLEAVSMKALVGYVRLFTCIYSLPVTYYQPLKRLSKVMNSGVEFRSGTYMNIYTHFLSLLKDLREISYGIPYLLA